MSTAAEHLDDAATGDAHGRDDDTGTGDRHGGQRRDPQPAHRGLRSDRRDARLGTASSIVATWSLRFLLTAAALAVLWWVLGRLWVIVLPLALAVLLATVLWPPTRLLRRVMPDALASLLVVVAAIAVLTGLVVWLSPQIATYVEELADATTGGLEDLQNLVTGPPFNLAENEVGQAVNQAVDQIGGWLQGNAQTIAGGVLSGVTTVGSILVGALLAVVLCFFMLKDGPRFLPWMSALAGPHAAPHAAEVARRSWTTLSGFIRAQALVGLVDAVAIGIGLLVIGVPLALPLSVLIFFGAFVPIIGATVTGILAALVALVSNGPTAALIVIALVLVVQQLEGNVLQPILVGHTLDLHPALVILAVTAGGSLFGIVGAFLAVPVVAVGTAIVRYGRERLDGPHPPLHVDPPPPPAPAEPPVDAPGS
ncbi:AI-2E family transporter [uncultured Cellulomonas sp.]|uniref:AI-2E family transporter n=1 Tax=uncultured Cellulomonas sp. TaxID=189682 RepID=UPI002617C56B|nr:AI-2E family transporter [uncultured Cellulomonas sp.]